MAQFTVTTPAPPSAIEPPPLRLTKDQKLRLGQSLYQSLISTFGDRAGLEADIQFANKMYEGQVDPKDHPWPGCSNFFVPLIPTQVDLLHAELTSIVFQPRFYGVNGNTPLAERFAHQFERYLNIQYVDKGWRKAHVDWAHIGLLDGVGFMEVLWRKTVRRRKKLIYQPETDPNTGQPMVDPLAFPTDTGEDEQGARVKTKPQVVEIEEVIHNEPHFRPRRIRDVFMIPAWNPQDIDSCPAVAVRDFLDETQLKAFMKAGIMWPEEVEASLAYVSSGQSERGKSMQGVDDVDIGATVTMGAEQGVLDSTLNPQRPAIEVWRFHSRQFDLNGDGEAEENIYWVHRTSQRLIGALAYPYWSPRRPLFSWSPFPRPDQVVGFGLPKRLGGLQNEKNAIRNQRRDQGDLILSPPLVKKSGAKLETRGMSWGPSAMWSSQDPRNDVVQLAMQDVPASSYQEEALIDRDAEKFVGTEEIQQTSQKQTKAQVLAKQFKSGLRVSLIATHFREAALAAIKFAVELMVQYGPDQSTVVDRSSGRPEKLTIPKPAMTLDYEFYINGTGGPLDKQQKLSETLTAYQLGLQNPLIAGKMTRIYALTRHVFEQMDVGSIEDLIGTEEEAVQADQAAAQAQQQQAALGATAGQPPQGNQPGSARGPQTGAAPPTPPPLGGP